MPACPRSFFCASRSICLALAFICSALDSTAADAGRDVSFDIRAGDAFDTFKEFAEQSGVQLVYAADDIVGVKTNPVHGDMTPDQAVDELLAGTALIAVHGPNGAIGVKKAPSPDTSGAASVTRLSVRVNCLINGRRNFSGSLIGGIKETQELMDFCGKHNIASDIELIPIQKINEAYDRLVKGDVKYRFVIDMASLKEPS
jgi:D-arabinose 1-dehydrogenase-like Zn-dependent alcohol dehydrogenase